MGVLESASGVVGYAMRQLDRVVSPSTRRDGWEYAERFGRERPLVGSLLTILTLTSLPPLLLFTTFVLSLLAFTAISAAIFVLFWVGVASLVLIPTLFFTIGLGVCVWAWGLVWFVAGRWVYSLLMGEGGMGGKEGKETVMIKMEDREGMNGEKKKGEVVVVNGTDGKKGKVTVEVFPAFEDVDCVGLMGGGMNSP